VDDGSGRDPLERQRVPRPDVGRGPGLDRLADAHAGRGEDVGLGPVGVVEKRDASRPVRVVLDRSDLRRHAVLRPLEVDLPVAALVPAALVARRDAALVVAATLSLRGLEKALLGSALRDFLERGHRAEAAAGARRLVFPERH
jgi:hypothetical protein